MTIRILAAMLAEPGDLALCTVLGVKGSAPRHAGSRMLVGGHGRILGSVGGGQGELQALEACRQQLGSGHPLILELEMQGLAVEGPDMVCGGSSRLLVEPLVHLELYRAALERLRQGEPVLLAKRLTDLATALLDGQGRYLGGTPLEVDAACAGKALATGVPVLAQAQGLLYDPLLPEEKLLILGAGHVGCALAALAPGLGFQVTVADDRPELLEAGRFPAGVHLRSGNYAELVAGFPLDAASSVVIVSRSHQCDLACVRGVLARPWRYAGFMGSLRKTRLILEQVATEGFEPDRVAALCAPIGLALGAETPEELAVAIAAELIAVRRRAASFRANHGARAAGRQVP